MDRMIETIEERMEMIEMIGNGRIAGRMKMAGRMKIDGAGQGADGMGVSA